MIDPRWRTSSYSDNGGECAEVAGHGNRVLVRDSKQEGRPGRDMLAFTPAAWLRFTAGIKHAQ